MEITSTPIEQVTTELPLAWRKRLGYSRREVAEKTGLTQAQVWRLEKLSETGEASMTDVPELVTLIQALQDLEKQGPKPKAMPKTNTNTKLLSDLRSVANELQSAINIAQEKKQGTTHFKSVLAHLQEAIELGEAK